MIFFTDGRKQGMMRTSWWTTPDGRHLNLGKDAKHPIYNAYLTKHIWPWFADHIGQDGWRVLYKFRYQRDMMIYWGAAIERNTMKLRVVTDATISDPDKGLLLEHVNALHYERDGLSMVVPMPPNADGPDWDVQVLRALADGIERKYQSPLAQNCGSSRTFSD